jgi:hypothetical protein
LAKTGKFLEAMASIMMPWGMPETRNRPFAAATDAQKTGIDSRPAATPGVPDEILEVAMPTLVRAAQLAGLCLTLVHSALPAPASAQTAPPRPLEQAFASSLAELPRQPLQVTGSIYVPVYSSVSISQGRVRADFSVTLSIHNASQDKPLVLQRVAYFDTTGKLVESYLQKPVALKPFASVEVYIGQTDARGGTGANFIVDWGADGPIAEPVVEALMLGGIGNGHYAFISQGRPIRLIAPR